jgi:FAD:protein FMN transferase
VIDHPPLTARPARAAFPSLGTTAELVVVDGDRLDAAVEILREELAAIDLACSRFRTDSEISRLHEQAGRPVRVGPLLAEALAVSINAARLTDGLVDPTVGAAVRDLGYDDDFGSIDRDDARALGAPVAAPGWWRLALDERAGFVLLPRGIRLDLGATAKALAADRAAARIAESIGCGVLVSLGGDISTAGEAPIGGWQVRVCDDHSTPADEPGPLVAVESGGLATSSTAVRSWRRGGRTVHHIVDPRTGDIPASVWRTATVAAATCVEANTASTAAVVLGEAAPDWLAERHLPARLVAVDGAVVTACGWPEDEPGEVGG